MKSNPYVYPYTPFKDLGDKIIRWSLLEPKTLGPTELKEILSALPECRPEIHGDTVPEKILSIFLDEDILFGPAEYITELRNEWLSAIERFTSNNAPLQFTLLGFPFKIPVKLKTDRTMPDMGELLILKRLDTIATAIREAYPPGAVITIFTEGAFGPFVGVPKEEADSYAESLKKLVSEFGFDDHIKVRALSEMEATVDNFGELMQDKVSKLKKLYETGDAEFMKKFNGAHESIYRIVSTREYADFDVMDAYNEALDDGKLSESALKVRRDIKDRSIESVLNYHAYLDIRDDIGFLKKAVPDALALTVSPKPKRLGIIPVNRRSERLPYHGVAVYHQDTKDFTIEYLIDMKREERTFAPVNYRDDAEAKPFFYLS